MQRITTDDDLLGAIDATMERRGFASRSEIVRDLIRETVGRDGGKIPGTACLGILSYVFDHGTRPLPGKLTRTLQEHHDVTVTMAGVHVRLDHATCLEVSILRGDTGSLCGIADALTAQRGVRHGRLIPGHR